MVLFNIVMKCAARIRISDNMIRKKFIDSLRIYVKGGSGGMGYPKYGGIGGAGGNVIVVGKEGISMKDVLNNHRTKRITAGNGENSHKNQILGDKGSDTIIEAPVGVSLYAESGEKLGEINRDGDTVLIAKGGIGGCPETGHSGLKGQSHVVNFDLKLIADVGFVGFPNAGKSTLLSVISDAKPKIGSYPFTTIRPNVGIIKYPDLRQISAADLPGLIEGAHVNIGMGHKFLKHVERTKLLLVIVDVGGFKLGPKYSSRSCLETIILLNKELELYREDLVHKPAILVVNKMDKRKSQDIFTEISAAMKDIKNVMLDVPECYRPSFPLKYERIISLTAKNNIKNEIEDLKSQIRNVLDTIGTHSCSNELFLENLNKKNKLDGPLMI